MAKKQTSVRKREREVLKRQRAMAKVRKAAEKRELRHNKPKSGVTVPPLTTPTIIEPNA
jgi:hypothetical protein